MLLLTAQPGAALPPNLSLSQILHTAWTAKQGAPGDIWALAQSPDGFLLLGTGSGLYRFDGVTFERIVPFNQPDLAFRDITALLALPSGEIWIGYYAGGVSELKNGVLTSYGRREGVPSGWITSFARESDGTLWVAAREGLGRFSAGHWETVSSDWNFRGHGAHWVLLDRQGALWATGGETVEFLPRGAHKFEDTGIRSGYNSTLTLAPDGTVWLGGESVSPRPLMKHQALLTRDESPGRLDPVKRLLVDRDGSIWGTDSRRGGVYRATQPNHDADTATPHSLNEMFTEAEGLTSNLAVPLLEDQEGNIWVGTNLGLNRFRATHFVREWRVPTSRTLYALAAAPDGSVWIASNEQLFEAHGSRCDLIASLSSPIRSAYREPGGALWLGTQEGLVKLLDKKLNSLPLPAPAQPVQYQYVHAMASDTSHGLWVSVVNRGLLRLDDRRWDVPGSGLQLPEGTPTALWTDTAGRQWLGYADGTAALRAGDSTRVFGPDQGLQVGPIMVIRGSPGEILVGGEWGLARFDGQGFRSLSASRLEAFSGISGIIVRANGDIWLNGNRGVVHMSSDALNDAYDHPLTTLRYDLFDVQDGLPGYAQQGEDASAVGAADGRLWFATNHGIAWIDPDHLIRNRIPPNVVIRSVGAGSFSAPVAKSTDGRLGFDVSVDATGQSTLPALTRDLQIEYTALSLVAPEKNQFRYKLEGYDRDWQDVGNRRQAFYTNLPPRNYRFRVIASNNSGVWNETGASLDFSIAPAYYQTAWFRTLVVVMFLSLLWAAHRLRLRVVERHQVEITALNERLMKAQEQERTRIAGELHDGVMQQISALSLLLGTGKRQPEADAKKTMAEVQRKLIEVGTEVRQLSHNLHPPMLKDAGLPEALRGYCDEFSRVRNVPVSCHADDSVQDLSRGAALAVYRIAQEAMGNAVTHGAARHVDVRLTRSNGLVALTVTDDGTGFDANRVGGVRGLGLINMRERARQLNGTFELNSEPGRGTTVRVTIPFRRAV